VVDGGDGADRVFGAGCDIGQIGRLCDNPGYDTLTGGAGDDDVRANACMTSPECAAASNISLGTAMDGGPGADTLLGADARDLAWGRDGADKLRGFRGRDALMGGPGDDTLDGGPGPDHLYGQAGDDVLTGGPGRDRLSAREGNDRIDARDGERDLVLCGRGRDEAKVDAKDRVRGCENIARQTYRQPKGV
jgi:Ca2+-binding RTX toxin-like protein